MSPLAIGLLYITVVAVVYTAIYVFTLRAEATPSEKVAEAIDLNYIEKQRLYYQGAKLEQFLNGYLSAIYWLFLERPELANDSPMLNMLKGAYNIHVERIPNAKARNTYYESFDAVVQQAINNKTTYNGVGK